MVDYDYEPIDMESYRQRTKPFEFSAMERSSLRDIKESIKNDCDYNQLTDFREYLDSLIEKVNTVVLQEREQKYDTQDVEMDLQFLRELQRKVIKKQHEVL